MIVAWQALSNSAALYRPDEQDRIVLDRVAHGLAASVVTLAYPLVESGGEFVMAHADEIGSELAVAYMQAVREELRVMEGIDGTSIEKGLSLDRTARNMLRRLCYILLGRHMAEKDSLRFPERLLEAIGPWYEPEAEARV